MKKFRSIIFSISKVVTIYVTIFFLSFLSLSFEMRKSSIISETTLNQYAEELNAENVYQVKINNDTTHLEIIVTEIGDIEERLKDVMYFKLKHNFNNYYFLFVSPEHTLL